MWFLVACAHSPNAGSSDDRYDEALGAVHEVLPGTWAVTPERDPDLRLCLEGPLLTDAVRVEGRQVRFSGVVGAVAPNERRACLPLELGSLRPE
jgi:hypothetical protein